MTTRLLSSSSSQITLTSSPTLDMSLSTATRTGGWLFYSNSPEQITASSGVADVGHFLNYVDYTKITGSGRIYVWHENATGSTITHQILIYNPSSTKSITVTPTNVGLTAWSYNDVNAWTSFWNGNTVPAITIGPNGYASLFQRSIGNGAPFGIIASVDIKFSDGTNAPASLYDIAYISSAYADNAHSYAPNDAASTLRKRGYATTGYFNYLTMNQFNISDTNYTSAHAFQIGQQGDGVGTMDCPYITDPSDYSRSGYLAGAFGCQQYLTIPIKNSSSSSRKIRLFAGNTNTSDVYFNAYGYGGNTAPTTALLAGNHYYDIFEDTLAAGASVTYTFQFVIAGGGSAPTTIGVRVV